MVLLDTMTDGSVRMCGVTVDKLVGRAKELGFTSIALADYKNMASMLPFVSACQAAEIKPIIGVNIGSAYLYAKNNAGKHKLYKLITRANELSEDGSLDFTDELVREFVDENVIICTGGFRQRIVEILSGNDSDSRELKEIEKEIDLTADPEDPRYAETAAKFEKLTADLENMKADRKVLAADSKIVFDGIEKRIGKAKEEKRAELEKELEEKKARKARAVAELPGMDISIKKAEANLLRMKNSMSDLREEFAHHNELMERKFRIEKRMEGKTAFERAYEQLSAWTDIVGKENVFVTISCHGSAAEKKILPELVLLAEKCGVRTVVSNTPTMLDGTKDDIFLREMLLSLDLISGADNSFADKDLRYVHLTEREKHEFVLTDENLRAWMSQYLEDAVLEEAFAGNKAFEEMCVFEEENGAHYPKFHTPDGMTSEEYLRMMIDRGIDKKFGGKLTPEYEAQLEHEFQVITSMGYTDYHLIVQDFLRYGRCAGKLNLNDPAEVAIARSYDIEKIEKYVEGRVGKTVGVGRGSAAGSLICDLLDITDLDPIQLKLFFERFLNPERVSMPDIDTDLETNIRPYVIDYVRHVYGESSVAAIFTRMQEGGRSALRNVARVLGSRDSGNAQAYIPLLEEITRKALEINTEEKDFNIGILSQDATDENGEMRPGLLTTFAKQPKAVELIKGAILLEGVFTHFGKHAAGIIVTDGNPVSDYIPLMVNINPVTGQRIMVTQCDMIESEKIGLLKIDFLGLKNLTVITDTLRLVEKTRGEKVSVDRLNFESEVFENIFAQARTNSVFQFESAGMKRMLKEFKPDSFEDLILLVAAYRPKRFGHSA